jgi:hypothetical protein
MSRVPRTVRASALLAICCCTCLTAAELRIEVLRGDSANNNLKSAGVPPSVRVLDTAGKPVAKALVVFSAPAAGPSVDFAGSGPVAQAQTDETGSASAPPLRPVAGDGPVEIQVMATVRGDTGNTVIHQMNLGFTATDTNSDLDIMLLSISDTEPKDVHQIKIKVVDAAGRSVAGASVSFLLQKINPKGKLENLTQRTLVGGPDGVAVFTPTVKTGNAALQYLVRATVNGINSTRVFPGR